MHMAVAPPLNCFRTACGYGLAGRVSPLLMYAKLYKENAYDAGGIGLIVMSGLKGLSGSEIGRVISSAPDPGCVKTRSMI